MKKTIIVFLIILFLTGTYFLFQSELIWAEGGLLSRTESTAADWNDNYEIDSLKTDGDDLIIETNPSAPSFFVRNSAHATITGSYIVWDTVSHNTGGHYSISTGKFTAPVDGIYHFSWGGIEYPASTISLTYFHVNGSNYSSNATLLRLDSGTTYYDGGSRQITVALSANDEVAIYLSAGGIYADYGHFTGHLVKEGITPSFFVRNSVHETTTGSYIFWDTVSHNTGGHYSTSTGKFTAPIDGIYHFSWGGIERNKGSVSRTYLYINGSNYASSATQLRLDGGSEYDAGSRQVILPLSANDEVAIYLGADGIYANYGHFTGHLVEEGTVPSFFVRNSVHETTTGSYIAWDTISHNTGGNYSTSTGKFTAPIDGIYHFNWGGIANNSSIRSRTRLEVNGSNYAGAATNLYLDGRAGGYDMGTRQVTLPLSLGDEVAIYLIENGIYANYGHFTGYLVGKNQGYRISDPLSLDDAKDVESSLIEWDASTPFGNALDFDGVDDYVSVNDPGESSLDVSSIITMTAWVKITSYPTQWNLVAMKGDTGTGRVYGMWIRDTGDILLSFYSEGSYYHFNPAGQEGFSLGEWHHLAGVIDTVNNDRMIYIDGIERASDTTTAIPAFQSNDLPLYIGSLDGSWPTHGLIDDVRIYNRALTESEIQETMNSELAGNETGLVGYWKLNEGSGTTTYDSTANNNDGTIYGATWTDGIQTDVDIYTAVTNEDKKYALEFDGLDDYLEVSHSSAFDLQTLSISFWIKRTGAPGNLAQILGRPVSASPTEVPYRLYWTGSAFTLAYYDGSSRQISDAGGITTITNVWFHYVGIIEKEGTSTNMKLYRDGNLVSSETFTNSTVPIRTSSLFMGAESASRRFFPGFIDDVRIYNRVLTENEIQEAMHTELAGNETGLVGYWKLNEGSGTAANDSSSNSNHGTISGASWTKDSGLFKEVTSGNSIPGINSGDDLTGKYLWVKQELSTNDPRVTPKLHSLTTTINYISFPTVTTQSATSISTDSATLNGILTDMGGASSTDVWLRWDTDDTLSDPNLTASSTKTATGTFDYTISGLDSGTTYYFQAVAENSIGVATGTILNFITLPPAPGTPTYDNIATSTLTINWSFATGTDYYHLERAASTNGEPPSGNFAEIATTTDLYYNDSGLTPNTQYWYRARATNESGTGAYGSASGQLLYPVPPSEAPTYGGVDHNSIEIFWLTPASGADYYSLERATSTPDTFVEVATTTATTTTDTELSPETTYYYRIKSVNQTGSSSASPYSSTSTGVLLPSVETNSATEITIDSAKLHGNLTDKGGASSVDVWFRWDTDEFLSDPNITASSTKIVTGTFDYTISGLDSGTTYYFQAVAENSAGIATGTILSFITLPPAPGTPSYDNIATSTLKIEWTTATGTDYYHLERAASTNGEPPSGNFAEIATTTDLYYNDSSLTPNTQYWYRARATNESGTGAYSSASGQLLYPVPPSEAPTYGGVDHNSIEIFWLAPASGVDYYSVERATSTPDTFVEVATTTATTTTDTELSPETTYYYRIKSVNQIGSSSASPYSSKTTLEKPIRPPEMESLDYRIWESSINVGGLDYQESTRYRLRETIGEAIAGDATSPSYKLRAGYQPMIDSYITASILVSATPEQVTMSPSIGGVIGGQSNGTTTIKVTTDSSSGYSLFVRSSASPALSTSSYSFADYIPASSSVPDYNWSTPATTTGFGFTPYGSHTVDKYRYIGPTCDPEDSGGTADEEHCWYNFSTSNETIAASYLSNHPDGTETYIRFRAESGNQNIQSPGEYSATLIITVIPN